MLSPARIVAVRPEIVVIRGSASTRPWPRWISAFRVIPNAIGERVSGWNRRNGGGVPPSGDEGVVSVNVEEIAGTPKLRPRVLGRVLVDFEDLGVEHDQFLLDVDPAR